jgi:hypothetical protein
MAEQQEHQPGAQAPETGHYEELNVFGSRTGRVEHVQEGWHWIAEFAARWLCVAPWRLITILPKDWQPLSPAG